MQCQNAFTGPLPSVSVSQWTGDSHHLDSCICVSSRVGLIGSSKDGGLCGLSKEWEHGCVHLGPRSLRSP